MSSEERNSVGDAVLRFEHYDRIKFKRHLLWKFGLFSTPEHNYSSFGARTRPSTEDSDDEFALSVFQVKLEITPKFDR